MLLLPLASCVTLLLACGVADADMQRQRGLAAPRIRRGTADGLLTTSDGKSHTRSTSRDVPNSHSGRKKSGTSKSTSETSSRSVNSSTHTRAPSSTSSASHSPASTLSKYSAQSGSSKDPSRSVSTSAHASKSTRSSISPRTSDRRKSTSSKPSANKVSSSRPHTPKQSIRSATNSRSHISGKTPAHESESGASGESKHKYLSSAHSYSERTGTSQTHSTSADDRPNSSRSTLRVPSSARSSASLTGTTSTRSRFTNTKLRHPDAHSSVSNSYAGTHRSSSSIRSSLLLKSSVSYRPVNATHSTSHWPYLRLSRSSSIRYLPTSSARYWNSTLPQSTPYATAGYPGVQHNSVTQLRHTYTPMDAVPTQRQSDSASTTLLGKTHSSPRESSTRIHRTWSTRPVYSFVQTTSLVVPTSSATDMRQSVQKSTSTFVSTSQSRSSQSTNYPSSVVPEGGDTEVPNDCLTFAVLFRDSLSWSWVVSQRNTTAQIFTYMPRALAAALDIEHLAINALRLERYKNHSTIPLTLYVAYAPNSTATALRSAILQRDSPLYSSHVSKVATELVSQINSSYDPFWYTGIPRGDSGDHVHARDQAIAGGVGGIGGAAVLVILFYVFQRALRRYRMAKEEKYLQRRGTIHSFSGLPEHENDYCATDPVSVQLGHATSSVLGNNSAAHHAVGSARYSSHEFDSSSSLRSLYSTHSRHPPHSPLVYSPDVRLSPDTAARSHYPYPVTKILGKAL